MTTAEPRTVADPDTDPELYGSELLKALVAAHSRGYVWPNASVRLVDGSSQEPLLMMASQATDYLPSVRRLHLFIDALADGESLAEACRRAGIGPDREALVELGDNPAWDTFRLVEYALRPTTETSADPVKTMGQLADAVAEMRES